MRQWFGFLVLVLVVAGSATAEDEVRIGLIAPLAGSVSVYGLDATRMVEILPGLLEKQRLRHRYRFITEEGACGKGSAAITAAQKMTKVDGVKLFVIGCSGEILQTAKLLEQSKALAICFACSHPDVRKLGDTVFRTFPDISLGVRLVVANIRERGLKKIAILTVENSFTSAIETILIKSLGEMAGPVEHFLPDDRDFRTAALKVRESGSDGVYLNAADPQSFIAAVRQLKEVGYSGAVLGYYQSGDRVVMEALGKLQDGAVFFDTASVNGSSPLWSDLISTYTEKFGEKPRNEFLLLASFNAAIALVNAVERNGTSSSNVREALSSGEVQGAFGPLSFDEEGDLKGVDFRLRTIVDGMVADVPHD